MKIYSHLPEKLTVKGVVFEMDCFASAIKDTPADGRKYRVVNVLSKNLRGKTDLHGREYQPSRFVYIETTKN